MGFVLLSTYRPYPEQPEPECAIASRAVRWMMERRYGKEAKGRIFVTALPDSPMAVMAKEEGCTFLPMPTEPGGAASALTAATLLPLAVVLSMLLALMLEARIPGKSQFRTCFLSPMMVPIASIILIWQVLFHSNGVVNEFLMVFGADKINWLKSDYCMVVIVSLFLWKNLGYNMILFMAALNNIPKELIEAAELDGATGRYIFFHIKLRYLSPTVLFVTILSIINSFKIFREIYLLTGDYPYDGLYMLQHFMNNMFKHLDYQRLSAAAVFLAIVIVILVALLFLIENYFGKDVEG